MAGVYFADTSAVSKRYVVEAGTVWLQADGEKAKTEPGDDDASNMRSKST